MTLDTEHADATGRIPTAVWINRPEAGRDYARRATSAIAGAAIALAIFAVAAAHGGSAAAPGWGAGAQGAFYLPAQIAIDPASVVEAQPPTF